MRSHVGPPSPVFHVGVSPAKGRAPQLGGGGKFWGKFFARALGARRAVLTYFGVVFSVFEAIWTLLRHYGHF